MQGLQIMPSVLMIGWGKYRVREKILMEIGKR
jgi:hypothetical protein